MEQVTGRPLRIALVAPPFLRVPPEAYGGTERIVAELAQGYAARGHEVTIYASGDSAVPGTRTRSFFARPLWPPSYAAERAHAAFAAAELAAKPPDLVHSHTPAFLAFADDLPMPVIHTLHHGPNDPAVTLYARVYGTHLVCISARQAACLAPYISSRPSVIHHGLDPDGFHLGDGRSGRALFLGRLDPVKAPHLAIDAALAAGLEIDLAGKPHAGGFYEREVRSRLQHAGVRHLGEIAGEGKRRLLAEAAVLLFPSVWEEPFGLGVIEAMLSGTPVVALRHGALPELVDPGVTGYLADDPADLPALVRDAIRLDRKRIRDHARTRFSTARMTADYLALFHRLLAGRSRPASAQEAR